MESYSVYTLLCDSFRCNYFEIYECSKVYHLVLFHFWIASYYIDTPKFTQSPIDKHLGCFQFELLEIKLQGTFTYKSIHMFVDIIISLG